MTSRRKRGERTPRIGVDAFDDLHTAELDFVAHGNVFRAEPISRLEGSKYRIDHMNGDQRAADLRGEPPRPAEHGAVAFRTINTDHHRLMVVMPFTRRNDHDRAIHQPCQRGHEFHMVTRTLSVVRMSSDDEQIRVARVSRENFRNRTPLDDDSIDVELTVSDVRRQSTANLFELRRRLGVVHLPIFALGNIDHVEPRAQHGRRVPAPFERGV